MERELKRALHRKQPITIIYEDNRRCITQRTIIVKLITGSHVLAYCTSKMQYRQFEVERILATDRDACLTFV